MSVAEIIAELTRLTPEELLQVQRSVSQIIEGAPNGPPRVWVEQENGRMVMRANRIITQAEIEEMLADFP